MSESYVDIEEIMPDHICTSCGEWVDEEEIEDVHGFQCPACEVWTNLSSTRVDPDEYGERWPPYKRRVVRL